MTESNGPRDDETRGQERAGGEERTERPRGLRGRAARAREWLRTHSSHALLVGVIVAIVGALAPMVASGIWHRVTADAPKKCPGAGCDQKNPETRNCGPGALTWRPEKQNPVHLQIRYSGRCHAVWGRITRGEVGDQVTISVRGGNTGAAKIVSHSDVFTEMAGVGSRFHTTACAVPTVVEKRKGDWSRYCVHATQEAPWSTAVE